MTNTWEINASPLMVQLRSRNVRLAGGTAPTNTAAALPPKCEQSNRAQEDLAYARGRMDGERAVNEQLLLQRQEIRELQERVLEPLRRAVGEVIADTEQSLVTLALQVAERLVSGLPIDSEMVRAALSEALTQIKDTAECHIYLHPEDLQLLQEWSATNSAGSKESTLGGTILAQLPDKTLARSDAGTALHFHANPDLERGGCVVKTRFGTVDGQRRTKVEQLRKTLLS
jgi:flagellar biosynthesis/type III secretory pathway protein FliH